MDNQTRPDVVFARDMNAGYDHARDIDEEVQRDENLPDNGHFDLIGPGTETIGDNGKGAELEKRCDSFTKEGLIFRSHTVGSGLAAKIGTNVFKHSS